MKYLILTFLLLSVNVFSMEIPSFSSPVRDDAKMLSTKTKEFLSNKLGSVYREGGPQIHILTIETLNNESLEDFSIKVANKAKLGNEKKDNGLLFLIVKKDRLMRIEVGSGLEGDLTDLESNRIIESMKPFFKASKYEDGIVFGLNAILTKTNQSISDMPVVKEKELDKEAKFTLFFIVGFGVLILVLCLTGNSHIALMLIHALASSKGGGRGSSGRGGGGGFSGGGSSGKW